MTISYAEQVALTCPHCGTAFSAEVYVLIDAMERPDLVSRILDDSLHDAACPHCGQTGRVPAPLLYHDAAHARVLLAVPADMPEAEWHAIGQQLLMLLIGALPEAARLPYLGEVQAEAGLAGIAQVIRQEGLTGAGAPGTAIPPIVIAIQALLNAKGPAELMAAFNQHAILRDPQAVAILQELAAEAIRMGQSEAAQGFARAAELLEQIKRMRQEAGAPAVSIAVTDQALAPEAIEALAFAVLRANTGAELARVVDAHPELLADTGDAALSAYAAAARAAGKTRIANGLDERLDAIRELRAIYRAQQPLLELVQAYLDADSPATIETLLVEHAELLEPAADALLTRLAHNAREDGDLALATFIDERRAFLQRVREALDAADDGNAHA